MKLNLPEGFVDRMRAQLGHEANSFFAALDQSSPTSIRLHHVKGKCPFIPEERVKWCDTGYYLESRPSFHLDPHWHGGAYYVQEASSMILDEVVRQLPPSDGPRIWLDLCAAPGGKTGILAKHLQDGDVLVSNEVVAQRRSILYENLIKGGYANTFISGLPAAAFPSSFADVILIDAPCAGEGMMRKEPDAIHQWSPKLVTSCSVLQQQIAKAAFHALKPNGILIYSTCSYSEEENIKNVSSFLETYACVLQMLHFPPEWNITTLSYRDAVGYQLFPHHVKGEGLFIAMLQKSNHREPQWPGREKPVRHFQRVTPDCATYLANPETLLIQRNNSSNLILPATALDTADRVLSNLPRAELISSAGQLKGKDFIPSHFLAMSALLSPDINTIDLSHPDALDFLERKIPGSLPDVANGWHLVTFEGTSIGWLKKTQQ
jgi:16S rRNA C967 or C1407 C5-methylase (RsmB/RsmF family)